MTFESYLESLAAEGETLLYVLQKPLQPVSFHADGAIKATWPAFLPGKKRREGQAWYANTAAFISDRMTERVSAAAANCEFVLVMVLDDIGTKSKTPPIEPTWKMETSPGNFQWGYAFEFDHQPRKGEFAAAIRAIADAGYTDPGACNPVRNFRLPGSVNLKQGRDGFVSRLVEFDETRTFTLAQICDALGVVPGPVEGDGPRPVRVRDDGGDDVFQWLSEQGMVYSRPNGEGWAGVLCPNAAEHTDGSPEGRYNPALRAFCCLHGHCTDWGSERFLTWVTSKGGPSQTSGLREELVSALLKASMPAPTGPLAEEAAAVIAEVERKEAGRLEQAEWFERYCYVESDDSFFDLAERRDLSRRVFDAVYRHIQCFSNFTTQAGKRRQIQASFFFDENRVAKGARSVAGMTYAAGDSELVARNGLVYVNRWRDGRPKVAASAAMPWRWLKHLERVIPNKDEREHVLNVMAWKVQHPTRKINHAVLHGGIQGAGKDSAWAPFFWTVGGSARENVALLENDRLQTQWGYHLESEVIIINELRQVDASDRRALENRLKSVIAAPPEYLVIERKGLHPYDAPNRTLVVAFSNERGAISLSHDDRRWFVIWTDSPPMTLDEGREFWAWLESGGFEQCAAFLHARDVSAFAPGATPMRTEAKALMAGASRSLVEDWLLHEISTRSGEFARPVIGSPWGRFCDVLQGRAPNGTRVAPTAVLHMMSEAGWVDLGQCHSKTHMTKAHIFAHRSWSGTKAEARDLLASYAAGAGGGVLAPLARVK